jgi:hypothetical protein
MTSDNNSIEKNGLMTKIWGPPAWQFLHMTTFGYPVNPTDIQKKNYKQYFTLVGEILPCRECRTSYQEYITTGDTELTNDVMKNRKTLTKWFFNIHNKVNEKLNNNYGMEFKNVEKRYESYRAGKMNASQCGGVKRKKKIYRLTK